MLHVRGRNDDFGGVHPSRLSREDHVRVECFGVGGGLSALTNIRSEQRGLSHHDRRERQVLERFQ